MSKSKAAGVAAAVKRSKKAKPKTKPKTKPRAKPKAKPKTRPKRTVKPQKEVLKDAPSSGQSAPPIELAPDDLNVKEARVLATLNGEGNGVRPVLTISDLAAACFKTQSRTRGNSWVRNSLRRLVQGGLVEKVDRGKYRVSEAGRKGLARAA